MQDIFVSPHHSVKKEEPAAHQELPPELKKKGHVHVFSSFCTSPHDVRFESQQENEKILLFLRSHFITNISWIFLTIVLAFIPILIPILLPLLNMDTSFVPSGLLTIFIPFYYLALFSYALVSFMTWFYNIFIVTGDRVVDIDYSNTVIHNVAETKITHIQDVNYNQVGFISSIFNYGDVYVQTAGNEVNFEALSVPNPRKATEIIANLIGGKK